MKYEGRPLSAIGFNDGKVTRIQTDIDATQISLTLWNASSIVLTFKDWIAFRGLCFGGDLDRVTEQKESAYIDEALNNGSYYEKGVSIPQGLYTHYSVFGVDLDIPVFEVIAESVSITDAE